VLQKSHAIPSFDLWLMHGGKTTKSEFIMALMNFERGEDPQMDFDARVHGSSEPPSAKKHLGAVITVATVLSLVIGGAFVFALLHKGVHVRQAFDIEIAPSGSHDGQSVAPNLLATQELFDLFSPYSVLPGRFNRPTLQQPAQQKPPMQKIVRNNKKKYFYVAEIAEGDTDEEEARPVIKAYPCEPPNMPYVCYYSDKMRRETILKGY
jgi:hypothetical protein